MAELIDVVADLRTAINQEPNPTNQAAMRAQLQHLIDAAITIADKNVGEQFDALKTATDSLAKGVERLTSAQRSLADVAKEIKNVAKLVDGVVKIAKLVAG